MLPFIYIYMACPAGRFAGLCGEIAAGVVMVYGDPAAQPSAGLLSARIAIYGDSISLSKQGQKSSMPLFCVLRPF